MQNGIFDSILHTSSPQPNDKQDGGQSVRHIAFDMFAWGLGQSDLWLVHGLVLTCMLVLISIQFSLFKATTYSASIRTRGIYLSVFLVLMLILTLMLTQFSLAYTCACAYAYAYALVKPGLKVLNASHWILSPFLQKRIGVSWMTHSCEHGNNAIK